jgi:hypothetical protein
MCVLIGPSFRAERSASDIRIVFLNYHGVGPRAFAFESPQDKSPIGFQRIACEETVRLISRAELALRPIWDWRHCGSIEPIRIERTPREVDGKFFGHWPIVFRAMLAREEIEDPHLVNTVKEPTASQQHDREDGPTPKPIPT